MVALKAWRGSTGLLLLGWLLCPSILGAADGFLAAYKQGRAAIDNKQWELAAEKMREALAGRQESGRLAKTVYLRRYLPHYFLGVALFELGDCEGALASWAESERQGVVKRRKDLYKNLVDSREQCQARPLLTQPLVTDQIAPLERQPAKLDSEVAEAQRAKERSPSSAEEQKNQRGDDGQQLNPPIQEVAPPPAELESAGKAFLDGDYPQVIEILGDFSAEEKRAMAHAHLLRSAALFALYRIRGDAELLTLARGEARAAHAAEPELTLPVRFFSPRFRELFRTMN